MNNDDEFDKAKFLAILGKRVARIRKSKGYSQDRLAYEAGLSKATLPRIESGSVDPQASTLMRIAETLEVPIAKFFDFRKSLNEK